MGVGELHPLQQAIVDALRVGGEPDAVRGRLLASPWSPEVREWIVAWDDRAVRAAVSLMARWGRWDGR